MNATSEFQLRFQSLFDPGLPPKKTGESRGGRFGDGPIVRLQRVCERFGIGGRA